MSLIYTPIATDTFQRANENPLNPANWFTIGGLPTTDQLAIVSDLCVSTVTQQGDGTATYIGAVTPNDQYCSIQLVNLTFSGTVSLYLRGASASLGSAYVMEISGPFNNASPDTGAILTVHQLDPAGGSIIHTWVDEHPILIQQNDVMRFGIQGQSAGNWFLSQNGIQISTGRLNDSPSVTPSGVTGLQLSDPDLVQSDAGVKNFVMGSVSGTAGGGGSSAWLAVDMNNSLRGLRH